MKFLGFMELRLRHPYYTDARCPDFEIEPAPDTHKLLKNHRCVFKALPDGMRILIAATKDNDKFIPFIPLQKEIKFNFYLRLQNSDFPLFTDLAEIAQAATPVYGNGEKTAGQLDLSSRQSALKNGVFADIEINCNDSLSEIANGPGEFQILFKAKKLRWKYHLVVDNGNTGFSIEDKDASPLVFSDYDQSDDADSIAETLADQYPNMQKFRFISDDLIPCQQQPRKAIQLNLEDSPVLLPLPNPSLRNYAIMETTANGNVQKEEILFQVVKYLTH